MGNGKAMLPRSRGLHQRTAQEIACGINSTGAQLQFSSSAQWHNTGGCADPDACTNGSTRDPVWAQWCGHAAARLLVWPMERQRRLRRSRRQRAGERWSIPPRAALDGEENPLPHELPKP